MKVSLKACSWIGTQDGLGAYPTINRQMTAALEAQGVAVLRNVHNDGKTLTPVQIICDYPPQMSNLRHAFNVLLTTWEFPQIPDDFREAFSQVDLILAMNDWTADHFRAVTDTPVAVCPLGFDPKEMTPYGERADWSTLIGQALAGKKVLLWIGGTDRRHGLDVAIEVIRALPSDYVLIAKCSTDYPEPEAAAEQRVWILRQDFPSLAPLYRGAFGLLHTARAVGFSLPALDAQACGCPVFSMALPPLLDFEDKLLLYALDAPQWTNGGTHHIHPEIRMEWIEPDPVRLAKAVEQHAALELKMNGYRQHAAARHMTWARAAFRLREVIGERLPA